MKHVRKADGTGRRDRADEARIEAEASKWVARRDGGLDAAGQVEFECWLATDERHAQVLARMDEAWGMLDQPRNGGTAAVVMRGLACRAQGRKRRQQTGFAVLAACLLLVSGWWWANHPGAGSPVPLLAEANVPHEQRLPDGSLVELNTGAVIETDFTAGLRRVRLLGGEAHFQVRSDAARPFVVSAGRVEVRAVGTAFAVRFAPGEVEVVVTEGRVQVDDADAPESVLLAGPIGAGHRVFVPTARPDASSEVTRLSDEDFSQRLAWRSGRLEFSATPLEEAVMRFNSRNRVQMVIGDPAAGALEVSGIVRVDNVEGFVRLLEGSFGVRAERRSEYEFVLRQAP